MKTTYQVEYSYYQHNSGKGDNGQYTQTLNRDTREEADAIAREIQATIDGTATAEQAQEAFDKWHPYTGRFSWVKVYEVTRTELAVRSVS